MERSYPAKEKDDDEHIWYSVAMAISDGRPPCTFRPSGTEVTVVDNLVRREYDREMGVDSLVPIAST